MRRLLCRIGIVLAWVAGLAAETGIQVLVTGVRPAPDARPQQVLVMMIVIGAAVMLLRRRQVDARTEASLIGAWAGAVIVAMWALTGGTTPPYAGLAMLSSTLAGAIIWRYL